MDWRYRSHSRENKTSNQGLAGQQKEINKTLNLFLSADFPAKLLIPAFSFTK
jgi:hypothetical protein